MQRKKKVRNYSFEHSKRIPIDRMTEINGVKIPSIPGTCYHAILCSLAENKDKFCTWIKIMESVQKYMRMYGGEKAWKVFSAKGDVKPLVARVKENTHTLTRAGRDCYGYRLHERGMCIYFFKDGAILFTGGKFVQGQDKYDVRFPGGRRLQTRYRGTTMTYTEYKKFLELGFIDKSGKILNLDKIRNFRLEESIQQSIAQTTIPVCVVLGEEFDQQTATRLENLGLIVDDALGNELIGNIPFDKIDELRNDKDVLEVQQA